MWCLSRFGRRSVQDIIVAGACSIRNAYASAFKAHEALALAVSTPWKVEKDSEFSDMVHSCIGKAQIQFSVVVYGPLEPPPDIIYADTVGYIFADVHVHGMTVLMMLLLFSSAYQLASKYTSGTLSPTAGVPPQFTPILRALNHVNVHRMEQQGKGHDDQGADRRMQRHSRQGMADDIGSSPA
jgi:hypothetical protein